MPTSAQVRTKIAVLASTRADVEKKISSAQESRWKKEAEANARDASAAKTSSDSMRRMYLRQAQSARLAALKESKRAAALSRQLSSIARDEGTQLKALVSAEKLETTAAHREADNARRERERTAADARKAEERRRQRERLAAEGRRRQDRAATATLIVQTEQRLTERIGQVRPPQKEQLRILYATATSHGDLRVDEEIRRVKAAVKTSTHRDQVRIEHLPAATAGDLLDSLASFRPHIVHFSGHGDETVLVFDTQGSGATLSASIFKKIVESTDEAPLLVVLNACNSATQLMGLLGKVPMAVGMGDSIGDVDALTFATRFYSTLAEGQSVNAALATARVDMEMNGLSDHDLPTLETVDGVDPSTVRLIIAD